MSPITITLLVLLAAIGLFVWNRLPVGIVAILVALTLFITGVISPEQAIAGFGDPVIVFIAALFVVSEGLDASGVTTWAGQKIVEKGGTGRTRLLTLVMLLVAALTALISVNGAVAALLPMVVVLALKVGTPPSQMLMPLAFAAHAGSLLLLTGTPVNVLINETAEQAGQRQFNFFEFGLVGIPLVIGTIVITVLFGRRLLPSRMPPSAPRDLSAHAETIARQYALENSNGLISHEQGITEVVVTPRSSMIGQVAYPGMVTDSGELVIAAIQRSGEDLGRTELAAGDVLLLRGTWAALETNTVDTGIIVIDAPASIRRQAAPIGRKAITALSILALMIVLLATGIVPAAIAALGAATLMVLLRVLTVSQAQRSISWTTLILVGGMIPLSTAIHVSGAADLLANGLVDVVGSSSPYLLLLGISLVTVILGQLISNMATALIIAPIAIAIAGETGISPLPLLMCVAVSAAASFLTPVATPANTMVFGPGAYRFGDYWKLGLPLVVLFVTVATLLVPVFWNF